MAKRFIADILTYDTLCQKVLEHDETITQLDPDGGVKQLVVPDVDSNNRGTPGLMAMYNRSSGLRLDDHGRVCIAAATEAEVAAGVSMNNPIVPALMAYAMSMNTFKDDINSATGANKDKAPSVEAVKNLLNSSTIGFHEKKLTQNATFTINQGMLAIVLPGEGRTLEFYGDNGSQIDSSKHGLTIVFASDKGYETGWSGAENYFRTVLIWIDGLSSDFNNNVYERACTIKNTSSKNAYVFYFSRTAQ